MTKGVAPVVETLVTSAVVMLVAPAPTRAAIKTMGNCVSRAACVAAVSAWVDEYRTE